MNNEEIEQNLIQNCFVETYKHVKLVSKNINVFIKELIYRSENHDNSKFEEPELSIYAKFTPELAKTEYGSKEYKELLEKVRPAIDHHYANNSHHPENWKNGIDDMDLLDILEMLADWKAATMRNKNGNIKKSIEINAERFNINPQLKRILENTVERYF